MATEQWLLLTDYASKYRVSVSTLRRRIKNDQIPFRFESGKYFIIDVAPTHPEIAAMARPTPMFPDLRTFAVEAAPLKTAVKQVSKQAGNASLREEPLPAVDSETFGTYDIIDDVLPETWPSDQATEATAPPMKTSIPQADLDEPLISTATKLLNELKRAYSSILHEKEEQIIFLKEEVSDLKTLVRVLEDDNERLKRVNSRAQNNAHS
jgi:hypothetical protein